MTRDEWPLVGIAIAHVLLNHVSEVWVLDHASRDGTRAGLERLQRQWPGQLHVLRLSTDEFLQEAATSLVLQIVNRTQHDWVYIFDADEFALTPGSSLPEVLESVPNQHDAISYEVQNWISLIDFDESDLGRYGELRYRAVVNNPLALDGALMAGEIEDGRANYFDFPFVPKIIFRREASSWIHAGAHLIRAPQGPQPLRIASHSLAVAHLPLLSRRRMAQRSNRGAEYARAGLPFEHGWQSRMVHQMVISGRLDDFWRAHSLGGTGAGSLSAPPTFEVDDSLARALSQACESLPQEVAGTDGSDFAGGVEGETHVPLSTAVGALSDVQKGAEEEFRLRDERIAQASGRQADLEERLHAAQSRLVDMEVLSGHLQRRSDALEQQLAGVLSSRSWRYSGWLRQVTRAGSARSGAQEPRR